MSDSLIESAKRQLDLLSSAAMPDALFADDEGRIAREFTGERLWKCHPETYQHIVSMCAERIGVNQIARLLRVSVNTVMSVQRREGVPIEARKRELSELCHSGAALALEGVVEDLADPTRRAKIGTRDKSVVAAVLIDKGQLLAGEATSRLEISHISEPDHDSYNRYIDSLRSAAGTGLAGENRGQKGAAAAAAAGPAVDLGIVEVPAERAGVDSESDVKQS